METSHKTINFPEAFQCWERKTCSGSQITGRKNGFVQVLSKNIYLPIFSSNLNRQSD